MAGHSKFKNIMHRKGAQDKKRAKLFSRLIREISVAARIGGTDPDSNPRLRAAVNNALSSNMAKDNIQKAINNDICKKVFKFVNDYSSQSFKDPLDLFTKLYNDKNFSISNRAYKGSQNLVIRARAQFIFGKYLGGSMIELFEDSELQYFFFE